MTHPRDKNNYGPGPADGLAILANTGPKSMPVENGWVAGVNVDGWTGCGAVAACPVSACLAAVVRTRKWWRMRMEGAAQ